MKTKIFLTAIIAALLVFKMNGCRKEASEPPDPPPQITDEVFIRTSYFDFFQDSIRFTLINQGYQQVEWNIAFDYNFLSLSPASGTTGAGDSVQVLAQINRALMSSELNMLNLKLSTKRGQEFGFSIEVLQYAGMDWLIEGGIVAAAFCRTFSNLALIMTPPHEFRLYNMADKTMKSLSLVLPPTAVSIGQNGLYAVVGHDGWFSYINLASMVLEEVYPITTHVHEIILAPNNWVYAFPKTDNLGIRCVELATGFETKHHGGSVRKETRAVLHPSGNYIYGATNGISPSDFQRYNIDAGTAVYVYDSPYHGDYPFYGMIWVSDNGEKLFARTRNIFNSSPDRENDMTYAGQLAGLSHLIAFDYSTTANRIYAVLRSQSGWVYPPDTKIQIYQADFATFIKTIPIPSLILPDGDGGATFYEAQGYYGFFNQSGSKYHILTHAPTSPGNYWGISTVDVE
jgi:hypothetical protein